MSGAGESSNVEKWGAMLAGLAISIPIVAILAVFSPETLVVLPVLGFLAWAGVRSGVLASEGADTEDDADVDPLATLQERYAAGEISEAEFEHRLDMLLDSDRRAEDADRLEASAVEHEATLERE